MESSGGRGARSRILAAARELFYRRGINATGVAELCEVAHVSRRTLYQHFKGKDALVCAYLDAAAVDPSFAPGAVLERGDLAPRARLLELFDALAEGERPLRGDPFVNAAVELPDPGAAAHRVAAGHSRRLTERLADLARAAGARDPESVAERLSLLYAGAAARVVLLDSAAPAAAARRLAAEVLQQALAR